MMEKCHDLNCLQFSKFTIAHTGGPQLAAGSKAWVCGQSSAGTAGSNTSGGIYVCVL